MLFEPQTLKAILTLAILALAVYGFVREKVPPDVTALLALLALLVSRVLTPTEAFAGFSHPATVSVAAVLVLSAGLERTGILTVLARRVLVPVARREFLLTVTVMLLIAVLSAFINNTAAVAVFIPIVLEVCRRRQLSPSRVLMPMSHAATFGGLCTLIGTSTNLVAHEFARNLGLPGFSMFEFGRVGLPMLLAGFAYILLIGRWFLPRVQASESASLVDASGYLAEFEIGPESAWVERDVRPADLHRDYEVEFVSILRAGRVHDAAAPPEQYAVGDKVLVRGSLQNVLDLTTRGGLELHRPKGWHERFSEAPPTAAKNAEKGEKGEGNTNEENGENGKAQPKATRLPLAEIVLLTTSGLIGRSLKDLAFASAFDVAVLAIRRRGAVRGRPSEVPLHAGDVLVVEGKREAIRALGETRGFLVIATPERPNAPSGKQLVALATLVGVVTTVALGWAPIVTAATSGCAVLMLTGCLRPREAYQAIDLSIVFLLAGSLALGMALEKTGLTAGLAELLVRATEVTGPYAIVAAFLLVSIVISELMSNSGTVALLGPIAVASAREMGVNPMSLLAAVALGSSAAFAMPIGYQTSLMIYGPGGYRFKDFIRMGIALDLILAVLALWFIPRVWPLYPPPAAP